MKAKDLMVPLKDHLKPEDTLEAAARLLRTARRTVEHTGVKGLPVLDKAGKMVGFLSMGDILKAVMPKYLGLMDLGHFTWDGMVESLARKVKDHPVSEMMTRDVVTVHEDSPLMECVDHMIKSNVKRLPVIDKAGKVVGILYERDVFLEITKSMLDEGGSK